MPQIINTNIASLNAQRNLNASQGAANTALERLSSGLRINSAKDDAAGLAISTRFDSQITGLNMAQRNANDGISLAQTAEGAMDEITNNLQRIRELSVQAANASNSISDRQALNQEVTQRVEEVNRIASQTSFNGLKVLDGTFGTQTFQVGANTGETIGISGLDSRGSQIGSVIKETDNFSDFIVSEGDAGTTSIDVSSLDLTATALSVDINLNSETLNVDTSNVATAPDPIAELTTAINDAIDGNGNLPGISASVSEDGTSIVLSNTETSPVSADISINDGTGAQKSVTGIDLEPLDKADFTPSDAVFLNPAGLNLTTDTAVTFSYDPGTGNTESFATILKADPTNDPVALVQQINDQLELDNLDKDLEAVLNGSNIDIRNKTSGTSYDLTSVKAVDGDTPAGSVTTGNVSLPQGTLTEQTEALASNITTNDLNFASGITGSLTVDSSPINFTLDANGSNDINALASNISAALKEAQKSNLSVVANSSGTGLDIVNSDTGTTHSVTDFKVADGGTVNAVSSTDPVPLAEALSLADSFAEGDSYDFNVNINDTDYSFKGMTSLNDIVSQINSESNETGVQANLNASNDKIIFSSQFGEAFEVNIQGDFDGDGAFDAATETVQEVKATVENDTKSMNDIDISSTEGADTALIAVDFAIDTINSFRATLGAVQNRFESTIANLATTTENLSASNSRIRDADFAAESAELARTQVLQQAGLSVLSQANARPQQVLQLLQG